MHSLLEFLSFEDYTTRLVTGGIVFLSMSAAVAGSFAFLRKSSLLGDAIAHAILPGIAIAFMVTHTKNPLYLLMGALLAGWLAIFLIEYLSQRTKLSKDTATAAILSVFFGLGILLLTHIQHSGAGNQSGLDRFLFGSAASMQSQDLLVYGAVAILLILVVTLLYKELMLYSFNPEYAEILGLPTRWLQMTLNTITVLAVAIGIQAVGVVLMAALLITPAAAARFWTDRLHLLILVAAIFGGFSGLVGSYMSFSAPQMPTGAWVVCSLSVLAILSILLAPNRGMLQRLLRQRSNRRKIVSENILKAMYQLAEKEQQLQMRLRKETLLAHRSFGIRELQWGLRYLYRRHFILRDGGEYFLSRKGLDEARRVVRLHRLWELYLSTRLRFKADHIHPNAETMEHIISPEIEQKLLSELGYPDQDPHESPIPYAKV